MTYLDDEYGVRNAEVRGSIPLISTNVYKDSGHSASCNLRQNPAEKCNESVPRACPPLYRFEPLPDLTELVPPESDEPNIYGRVVRRVGNIRLRFSGSVWSLWAGPMLVYTTRDVLRLPKVIVSTAFANDRSKHARNRNIKADPCRNVLDGSDDTSVYQPTRWQRWRRRERR